MQMRWRGEPDGLDGPPPPITVRTAGRRVSVAYCTITAPLLHHLAVRSDLIGHGFLIAGDDDGHLVRVEVLLGDALDVGGGDRVDPAYVGGEVVVPQAVKVYEAELNSTNVPAR